MLVLYFKKSTGFFLSSKVFARPQRLKLRRRQGYGNTSISPFYFEVSRLKPNAECLSGKEVKLQTIIRKQKE